MRFNWNYFFSEEYYIQTMQGFKDYLASINKTGDTQCRIVNTYKRVNDIVTNNSEDYDNFRILISKKKK